jgi:hypothetical protein
MAPLIIGSRNCPAIKTSYPAPQTWTILAVQGIQLISSSEQQEYGSEDYSKDRREMENRDSK